MAARRPDGGLAGLDRLRRRRRRRLRERRARVVHPLGLAELGLVAVGRVDTPDLDLDERDVAARGRRQRERERLLLADAAHLVELVRRRWEIGPHPRIAAPAVLAA